MVDLDSYRSVGYSGSGVVHGQAETLKSKLSLSRR